MQNCECTARSCRRVTHVIFDLDGTLIDSEGIYENAFRVALAHFDHEYTIDLHVKVLGRTEKAACDFLARELALPASGDDLAKLFRAEALKSLSTVELMPGAYDLVKHLHAHRVPMAIATSSEAEPFDVKMARHRAFLDHFHHYVCGGSDVTVKNSKPAPDIFLICASRFDDRPNPRNVLVFEDAPNGLTAALAAGMRVVLVPSATTDPRSYAHAQYVYKSLEDVELEAFGLPPLGS